MLSFDSICHFEINFSLVFLQCILKLSNLQKLIFWQHLILMPYVWNNPCVGIAPTVWCHFWQLTGLEQRNFLKYNAKVATIKADAQYLEGAQAQLKDQSLPLAEILWGEGKNSVVDSEQRDEEQGGACQTPVNTQHTQRRFRRLIKSQHVYTQLL